MMRATYRDGWVGVSNNKDETVLWWSHKHTIKLTLDYAKNSEVVCRSQHWLVCSTVL